MESNDQLRWRQRLENYRKACVQLENACGKKEYSDLERAGLVQVFEFSFELARKTLKDLLLYGGYDVTTPREVLRRSFAAGYLGEADAETLLDALKKRNLLAHTYREELAQSALTLIRERYFPALRRLLTRLETEARR